jgi:hypothetical protein
MTVDDQRRQAEDARAQGDHARDEGRWSEAAEAYRAYLTVRPHDAAIWIQLGHMRTEAGDYQAADRAYRTAWRLTPEDPDLLLCWGRSRLRAGDLVAARAHYASSYRIDRGARALEGLMEAGGRLADAQPIRPFRIAGGIDRVSGREVAGHVRAPVRADAYVEFRSEGAVVGRADFGPVLKRDCYRFEASLDLDQDARVDAYLMPDEDGFHGSPFQAVLAPPDPDPTRARDARVEVVRRPELRNKARAAILSASSTTGALRPNVEPYVRALAAQDIGVTLIVSTDRPLSLPTSLLEAVDGLIVRSARGLGLDLAGWAHALSLFPDFYGLDRLLLLSDSLAGPTLGGDALTTVLTRIWAARADLVALTERHDQGWRPERYVLALTAALLSMPAIQRMFETVPLLVETEDGDRELDRALVQALERSGASVEVLFTGVDAFEPLRRSWRRLLRAGLPFADPRPPEGDEAVIATWRSELERADFDLDEVDELRCALEHAPSPSPGGDRLLAYRIVQELPPSPTLRLALMCDWTAATAEGQAWRTLASALREVGCEVALHPVNGAAQDVAPATPQADYHGPPDIALIELGSPMAGRFNEARARLARSARRRIGFWFEAPPTAEQVLPGPRSFDLHHIWTLPQWASDVLRRSDVPVEVLPPLTADALEGVSSPAQLGGELVTRLRGILETRTLPALPQSRHLAIDLRRGLPLDEPSLGRDVDVLALGPDGAPIADLGLELAERFGDDHWIVIAPQGAVLAPDLATIVRDRARVRPDVALFYADDLAVETDWPVDQLRLKPEFDPTLLAAQDYVGFPVMIRAGALAELGGLDPRRGTAAVSDLLFRAEAAGFKVGRIAEVLLAHPGRRVRALDEDYRAMLAAQPLLRDYDIRTGRTPSSFALSRRWAAGSSPAVTLLVPTCRSKAADGQAYVNRLLDRLTEAAWPMDRLTVLIGDDFGDEPDWARHSWPFSLRRLVTTRAPHEPFNYATKMNRLWRAAETEQLVMLNDDVLPIGPDWLAALQTFAVAPEVGGVGAKLLFEDGSLQHAGLAPHGLDAAHVWVYRRHLEGAYQNWPDVHREWSMVTGAVFATRRSVLQRLGGFDERFSLEFNDSDLCLRMRSFGYRIVYTPHAGFVHTEKASRGEKPPPGPDRALFRGRWSAWLENDPSWHPRLRRDLIEVTPEHPPSDCWFL